VARRVVPGLSRDALVDRAVGLEGLAVPDMPSAAASDGGRDPQGRGGRGGPNSPS
jgi:hypothetical protein